MVAQFALTVNNWNLIKLKLKIIRSRDVHVTIGLLSNLNDSHEKSSLNPNTKWCEYGTKNC